jgi:APA family basic amino acid/polyamine antiporter
MGVSVPRFLDPGNCINIFGALLQLACTFLLMAGVEIGKITINIFSCLKVVLVLFMIIAGFTYFQPSNLVPIAPYGVSGVMRGATSAFFG